MSDSSKDEVVLSRDLVSAEETLQPLHLNDNNNNSKQRLEEFLEADKQCPPLFTARKPTEYDDKSYEENIKFLLENNKPFADKVNNLVGNNNPFKKNKQTKKRFDEAVSHWKEFLPEKADNEIFCKYALLMFKVLERFFESYWMAVFIESLLKTELRFKKLVKKPGTDDIYQYTHPCAQVLDDMFKPGFSKKEQCLSVKCVVPNSRFHWDVIMAIYHISNPIIFPDMRYFALQLGDALTDCFRDLKEFAFDNYSEEIQRMLVNFGRGVKMVQGNYNWFLHQPAILVYILNKIEFLEMNGIPGNYTDEQLKGIKLPGSERTVSEEIETFKKKSTDFVSSILTVKNYRKPEYSLLPQYQ